MKYKSLDFGIIQYGLENPNLIKIVQLMLSNPFAEFTEMRLNSIHADEDFDNNRIEVDIEKILELLNSPLKEKKK